VKVFDGSGAFVEDIAGSGTAQSGFTSLRDSSVAVDQTDGHLFVADNTEPGFEAPAAVIDEFNPQGDYRGQIPRSLVAAEPNAVAVDESGNVYVTSGNTEEAVLYGFGPTVPAHMLAVTKAGEGEGTVTSEPAGISCGSACRAEYNVGEGVTLVALPVPGSVFAGWTGCEVPAGNRCSETMNADKSVAAAFELAPAGAAVRREAAFASQPPTTIRDPSVGAAASEVIEKRDLRVSVRGDLSPKSLPRTGSAPVMVTIGGRISTLDGATPPQLRQISIAINRYGHFRLNRLPKCSVARIQPATNAQAMKACGDALVGTGNFAAQVLLPQQAPFPSQGNVLAFNGTWRGQPALLAHIYGMKPIPTSYTVPFLISNTGDGTYGTVLTAELPQVTSEWGSVRGLTLNIGRKQGGNEHAYITANCPAPKRFTSAPYTLARVSFAFTGGPTLTQTLGRSCRVRE
jgi:Divergent InlB B-repeat domain